MNRLRKLLVVLAGFAGLLPAAAVVHAQCDIPLIVGVAANTANVLIILDNSDSMNEPVYHAAYNPKTTYSGQFTNANVYNISSTGTYSRRSFNNSWSNAPAATLVRSDGGASGQYSGNYLNWIFTVATNAQRGAIPPYTNLQA